MNQLKPSPIKAIMIPAINPMIVPPQTAFGPFKKNKNNKISATIVKIVHIIFPLFYLCITTKLSARLFAFDVISSSNNTKSQILPDLAFYNKSTKKQGHCDPASGMVNITNYETTSKLKIYSSNMESGLGTCSLEIP